MADSLFRLMSYFHHASWSHFSAILSATCNLLIPVLITCKVVILISHYFAIGTRNPLITGGKGSLRKVLKILSTKCGVYHPTVWTFGGYLQTVFGQVLRGSPKVEYISEDLELPDGGVLRLDWTSKDNQGKTEGSKGLTVNNPEIEDDNGDNKDQEWVKEAEKECQDIVLILPGLTGDSHASYTLQFAQTAKDMGYRVAVLNHRGTSLLPVTYRFSCAANSDDLEFVVELIHKRYPKSRICAVGVSLGGIITTNYLIRMSLSNMDSNLLAAFVISVPYDSFVAADSLERPLPCFLFNRVLTRRLQKLFVTNSNALKSRGIDVPEKHATAVAKADTIRQFDDAVIAPMFGYKDVDDYYQATSIVEKPFECIKTPLLCLSAQDDPFSPCEQIPVERIKNCDNVALVLTHTGGHVGFLEGLLPTGHSYMDRVFKEFIKAAFHKL